jgi:hypothetical protein
MPAPTRQRVAPADDWQQLQLFVQPRFHTTCRRSYGIVEIMKAHMPKDGCPQQLEFDLGELAQQEQGASWRYKSPSRWTRRQARAYARRAKAAHAGNGEAQRECLSWLDTILHQPLDAT